MALIRVYQAIDNEVWKLNFVNDITQLSEDDKKRMQKYGEPEVDFGGTYLAESENEFTLPTKNVRIRSDLPITIEFDSRDEPFDTATQTKVEGYRTEVIAKITDAMTTLRETADTFTGEHTYNL